MTAEGYSRFYEGAAFLDVGGSTGIVSLHR